MIDRIRRIIRAGKGPPALEEDRLIERYVNAYHALLGGGGEVAVECLESLHQAVSSSLHRGAAAKTIMVSAFLYSALRLPDCMERVDYVVIGASEPVFRAHGYEDINMWEPAPAQARRRKALFNGQRTLAVCLSSISDIDDLVPSLCAYQIEWNKMHARLSRLTLVRSLAKGRITASAIGGALKAALGVSTGDYQMLAEVWGSHWDRKIAALASAPKSLHLRMLPSDQGGYKKEVKKWWASIAEHFRDAGIERRPLYLVSSNTHSLANLISGFAYRHRDELIAHAFDKGSGELYRTWEWLQRDESDAKLNFYYHVQREYVKRNSSLYKIQRTMEENAGLQRFGHERFLDQETQIIDVSRINPDCIDIRVNRRHLNVLKKSSALILNIDYPLGFSAYYIMSQIAEAAANLRGVYVMGKSAAMIGRLGDIMIPSEISDEHTRNRYMFKNCFSVRNLVAYLSNMAVFDDQKSVTVRGTFLHNWDSVKHLHKEDFTGIEMEAGPYLSALYEYIHGRPAPRNRQVRIEPPSTFDIGILHYCSDTPYNVRASLLSSRMGYAGVEAAYTCALPILQLILSREICMVMTGEGKA